MKKIFMLIFAGLLILGCSKAEPKEDQQVKVTTTPELVAGASYLPQLDEEIEQDFEGAAIEAETEVVTPEPEKRPVTTPKTTSRKTPEKTKPSASAVLPEPSDDDITVAIEKNVEQKIATDEKVTKDIVEEEVTASVPVEEKKAPMGIIILIGAAAAGGIGYLATRKKSVEDSDIE